MKGTNKLLGRHPPLLPFALLLISQVFVVRAAGASAVVCEETPHTRIESSICGEPVLRALDQELAAAVDRAVVGNKLDRAQVTELRNGIAKLCWREVDTNLQACLLGAELDAFEWVTKRLNEWPGNDVPWFELEPRLSAAKDLSSAGGNNKRLTSEADAIDFAAQRVVLLHRQLGIAESSLKRTGNTDLTVATIAGLLETLQQQSIGLPADSELNQSITQLVQRMVQGCNDSRHKKKWRSSLRQQNLSCAEFSQQVPQIATSEFY